jgi:hypothetical protein
LSDYRDTKKQIRKQNQAVEMANNAQIELSEFFARHNEICDNEANRNICNQYFAGEDITLAALEESYAGHPQFKEMLCTQSEKHLRNTLQFKIVDLLSRGTSKENIKAVTDTFRFKSTAELKAKSEELERRADFKGKTVQELREIIRRPKPGFRELPPLYRTKSMLLTLPPSELRRFIDLYGSDNINAALNSKE